MFLDVTVRRNKALLDCAFQLHRSGAILPDTYVIDLDAVIENGRSMIKEANKHHIDLFVMAKQYGRNPLVTKELVNLGFSGAVAVDYREAKVLHENGVPISHIGHLVQIPASFMEEAIGMKPGFITIYSLDKAAEIDEACRRAGRKQNILIRVIDKKDILYPAQYGGFYLDELDKVVPQLLGMENLTISGVTSFPCFLYDEKKDDIFPTPNITTLHAAKRQLEETFRISVPHINMPSSTCTETIGEISRQGGTQGEPGHGLLGSTPLHAKRDLAERPAMVYVSEISHQLDGMSYCYGGGHYRRSHMEKALAGKSLGDAVTAKTEMPDPYSIDYHIGLEGNLPVGETVIMAFRTQVFVTRSHVAVVKGLSSGKPELSGIYDSQGREVKQHG